MPSDYPQSSSFWSASSSWYQARKSAQKKATDLGVGPMERKADLWRVRGEQYLRGSSAPRGQAITVDPKLSELVLDMMNAVAPAVVRAYDEHLGKLALKAWREWPVSTGLSRSLIALEYSASGLQFTGSIVNPADYVFFIKGSPHRNLIDVPGRDAADRIGRQTISDLAQGAPK